MQLIKEFAEFAQAEIAAGGPDSHVRCAAWISQDCEIDEKLWRAGVITSIWNVPGAEAIWQHWPRERIDLEPQNFQAWLEKNWQGLPFRKERRAVRTPKKLARSLCDYVRLAETLPDHFEYLKSEDPVIAYEKLWPIVTSVYGIGRYAGIKLLEYLRRYCGAPIASPDIRPTGGWSPREALCLFDPANTAKVNAHDDSYDSIMFSQRLADRIQQELIEEYDLPIGYYRLQGLLCNFREYLEGHWYYPGLGLDEDLSRMFKVLTHFGSKVQTDIWKARANIAPQVCLGEVGQRWSSERKELGYSLSKFQYIWSDITMDYQKTTDLANPVYRESPGDIHTMALSTLASEW